MKQRYTLEKIYKKQISDSSFISRINKETLTTQSQQVDIFWMWTLVLASRSHHRVFCATMYLIYILTMVIVTGLYMFMKAREQYIQELHFTMYK